MSKTLKWSMISVMVLGAVIVIVLGFLKLRSPEKKEEHHYTIMELTEQEPLVLDGNIETAPNTITLIMLHFNVLLIHNSP